MNANQTAVPKACTWKRPTMIREFDKSEPLGVRAVKAFKRFCEQNDFVYNEPMKILQLWGFEETRYIAMGEPQHFTVTLHVTPKDQVVYMPLEELPAQF